MSRPSPITFPSRSCWRVVACAAVLAGGCVGEIGGTGNAGLDESPGGSGGAAAAGGGSGSGSGGRPGSGGDPGSGGVPEGKPGMVCGTYKDAKPGIGPAPLRRLTRAEYNNTIFDLLGDDSQPALSFATPDVRAAGGFDNNAGQQVVTATQAEDYFEAAESLAAKAVQKPALVPVCTGDAAAEEGCAATFISTFGKRAFRRPLTGADAAGFMSLYTAVRSAGGDYKAGIKMVMTSLLLSPSFLYRPELGLTAGKLTSWEMASRLSYFLWRTMPDPMLFAAAENNMLSTPDQIKEQAARMLADGRAKSMVASFHEQWLGLYRLDLLMKDDAKLKTAAPFASVQPFMREETTRYVARAFWQGDGSVEGLFKSPTTFMNKELATFLGLPGAAAMKSGSKGFAEVMQNPEQRSGVLTQAAILSMYAKPDGTLPVVRGKFLLEQFACADLPPAPANAAAQAAPRTPDQTTREFFTENLKTECASCHKLLDPIGFAFENFDAVGRWRTTEAVVVAGKPTSKPIDATGTLTAGSVGASQDATFNGAVELSNLMAASPEMKKCVAKQWMRFALGRSEVEPDTNSLEQIFCTFEQGHFNMRDLVAGIVQSNSFRMAK